MSNNMLEERVGAHEILFANLLTLMPLGDLQNLHFRIRNQATLHDESPLPTGVNQTRPKSGSAYR
ncbi:hypothetical protein [Paraburkholderia sp. HD33-4]|uniref:hypothetical protein n=1 Tax=Paraburkholderia sp. HD33-4 TaxID=2883242 RepID=UPI001F322EB4|nr:hypothetical protein [Paraburkholderia sp. HD33-4]